MKRNIVLITSFFLFSFLKISTIYPDIQACQQFCALYEHPLCQQIPEEICNQVSDLLSILKTAFWYEKVAGANEAADKLEKILQMLEAEHIDQQTGLVEMFCSYDCFFIEQQINHLRNFSKQELDGHSAWDKKIAQFWTYITWIKETIVSFWSDFLNKPRQQTIGDLIVLFATFEREFLLNDIDRFTKFLKSRHTLPEPIDFWSNPHLLERAGLRVQRNNRRIQTQSFVGAFARRAGELVKESAMNPAMAGQGLLMGVGGLYGSWVNDEDKKRADELQKKKTEDKVAADAKLAALNKKQTTALTNLSAEFKKKIDAITAGQNAAIPLLQNRIRYLQKSISSFEPRTLYLSAAVETEQLMMGAALKTPGNGFTWYKPFYYAPEVCGSWEFDSETESFVQWGQEIGVPVPFGNRDVGDSDPAFAQIFTDYYSGTAQETLIVEVTLCKVDYPFFAGIMFNKARWVSGDYFGISRYRLAGLYGNSISNNGITKNMVSLSCAEQRMESSKSSTGEDIPSAVDPLTQIIKDPATRLTQLPDDHATALADQARTYRITIISKADAVTVTLDLQTNTTPGAQSNYQQISQVNVPLKFKKSVFFHHGIGFIAVGCLARFKIIQPETLRYSTDQLKAFQTVQPLSLKKSQ